MTFIIIKTIYDLSQIIQFQINGLKPNKSIIIHTFKAIYQSQRLLISLINHLCFWLNPHQLFFFPLICSKFEVLKTIDLGDVFLLKKFYGKIINFEER